MRFRNPHNMIASACPAPRRPRTHPASPLHALIALAAAALLLGGCTGMGSENEMEASTDSFACKLGTERIVVRFTEQEARILMPPDEHLVTLYQMPTGGGVRYSNGMIELRGSGANITLIREDVPVVLTACEPLKVPKKSNNPFLLK